MCPDNLEKVWMIYKLCLYDLESFQTILKVSGRSKKCPDHLENVAGLSKILQNHLLCAFVVDLKIDAIYALYPESFCDKNLVIRKVFAFCNSGPRGHLANVLSVSILSPHILKYTYIPDKCSLN